METFTRFIRTYWKRLVAIALATVIYFFAMTIVFLFGFRASFDRYGETAGLFVRFAFALAHLGFAWFVLQYFRRAELRIRISRVLRRVFRFRTEIGIWMAIFLALHLIHFSIRRKYFMEFAAKDPVGLLPWEYGTERFIQLYSVPVGWIIEVALRTIQGISEDFLKRFFFLIILLVDFPSRIIVGYTAASIFTTIREAIQRRFRSRASHNQ